MESIPFARPTIGAEEKEAVLRVLESGWLTTGAEALSFEREFASFIGSRYVLAVNSATAGLHLALEAAGIGSGDIVYTTPYTFTATAEVVRYVGAEIQFVDIDWAEGLLDPNLLEEAVARTRRQSPDRRPAAVIPVHLGGVPCDMPRLKEICAAYNLFLLEDAAHAFPSRTTEGYAGTLGDAGVFSFYATKPITTGEGGMVCTDSEELAQRISVMRLHGIDREAWERYSTPGASWYYEVVAAGFKYNLSDLAAALGRVQLSRAQELLERRRQIARQYIDALGDCDFCSLPAEREGNAWHLFPIQFDLDALKTSRERIVQAYTDGGIGTSVHYIPLHLMPYYAERYHLQPDHFPVSLERYRKTISIPLYPTLSEEHIDRIISVSRSIPDLTR